MSPYRLTEGEFSGPLKPTLQASLLQASLFSAMFCKHKNFGDGLAAYFIYRRSLFMFRRPDQHKLWEGEESVIFPPSRSADYFGLAFI